VKTFLSFLVLASLTLSLGCGKKTTDGNMVNLDQPTTVIKAPKAVITIEVCESLQPQELCNCLDRVASSQCASKMRIADSHTYDDCLAVYLDAAYRNYCSIDRAKAYTDADQDSYFRNVNRFRQSY